MDRGGAREKAVRLVAKMTIEEKISQLRYDAPAIDRLGIPAYNWWGEALHGVARAGTATSFPQAISMAASFDEELIGQIAGVIAEEGRAKYNAYSIHGDRDIYKGLTFWSPNVNIFRDPRWGRGQETYGEDPYLSGTLGSKFVRGLQGDGEYMKAAACAKHFAVHSGPEAIRHSFNAKASAKDLHETYLPAFECLVKDAGVEAVMGAYNRTNDEPCCASPALMRILRGDWGFEGHFVSDCWAIRDFYQGHNICETPAQAAALALNEGCDLNCGNSFLHLLDAWKEGLVTEDAITEAAVRLFTTRFLLGLFDETEFDDIPYTAVECPEHLKVAAAASAEGIVLLKNDGILPLNKQKIRTIGVIGPNANSRAALIGNYHGTATRYVTVLDGILQEAGDEIRVLYSDGCDIQDDRIEHLAMENDRLSEAEIVAENSDVVILVLGLNETLEGEEGDTGNSYASGDKLDLFLPSPQRELLRTLAGTDTPVIVCMMTGSAMDMSFETEHFNAILQAWYPGAQGGSAVADILFGKQSPSGKLPVTIYHNEDVDWEFTDYSLKGKTYRYLEKTPLYPFGYGLTYGDAQVRKAALKGSETASKRQEVLADVENCSPTAVREVVQVYAEYPDDPDAAPHPRLCGFQSTCLAGGETARVNVRLDPHFREVIRKDGTRDEAKGRILLHVGTGQPDKRTFELTGKKPIVVEVNC